MHVQEVLLAGGAEMLNSKGYSTYNKNNKNYDSIDIYIKNSGDIFKQCNFVSPKVKILKDDIESHIYETIKNFPESKQVILKIHILSFEDKDESWLIEAVQRHFLTRLGENERVVKQKFMHWMGNMIIGCLFLILCLMMVEVLDRFSYIDAVKILKESLMIIGWVALWEPMTFILFQWRSIKKSRTYYRKLYSMPVIIVKK